MIRKNLQNARKAAGLTQQAAADKLGIGLRSVTDGYYWISIGEEAD